MNKIINTKKNVSHKGFLSGSILGLALVFSLLGFQSADAYITSQLDLGSQGKQVTELQTYLSTDRNIYPSGLITGYFGSFTQSGVQKFQSTQGIVSAGTPETTGYGRVGPKTMSVLNTFIGGGVTNQVYRDTVPVLSAPLVQKNNTSATITWTTSEPTQGQVNYDSTSLRASETTGIHQQPYVSGSIAIDGNGFQTNHTVKIDNLQSNTLYYYMVRGVDNVGNTSVTLTSTFRTD
jgi:peptidoglycan hydrolase-like protein with peptidoglycan-binding domain